MIEDESGVLMERNFTKHYIKSFIIFFFFFLEGVSVSLMGQQTQSPGIDSVVVTFNNTPTKFSVVKAPLKYNKAFAMSFQEDDALSDIYKLIYPVFQGTNGNPGLYYTDGCGHQITFKMSSAIFIFGANGSDILNPNDPYHDPSKLTWPELKTLYQNHWGIDNHGLFDNPDVSSPEIINYAFQRTKSYTRRKISDSMSVKSFVIPNNVVNFVDYLKRNHYHSAINQGQDNTWIGYGKNGFNVESDTINWLKPVKLFRDFSYSGFKTMADTLYQASLRGEHRWYLSGMHQMPGSFLTDMKSIYQTYGAPGLDDILITNDDDLLDYFAVKQATQVHENLKGNRLVITFSGNVPVDLLHYDMTLNVTGNEKIQNIQIFGATHSSYHGVNADTALINFSWNGRKYQTTEYLADSFSTLAVQTQSQYHALVAMDYVLQMPKGDKEVQLRKELCSMDQSGWHQGYDAGFCGFPDLGNDTTICSGSTITFKGPANMQSYQWLAGDSLFSQADSVKVQPKVSTQYFLTVKNLQGQMETDSVWVYVSPAPQVDLGNDTILLSEDTLTFSAPSGLQYDYLWSNGDTTPTLTLETKWDSVYKISVKVTNQAGCTGHDSVRVTLPPKDSVPEVVAFQDSVLLCNGDSVVLKASSNTKSLTWSWSWHHTNTDSDSLIFVPDHSEKVYVNACNQYGCSAKDSIFVTFAVPPKVQMSPDTSICLGDRILLHATGGKSIRWSDLSGTISSQDTLEANPLKTTVYSVKTWNQKGCVSTDSVKVEVNPNPETLLIYDSNRVCQGSVITLMATGADSYHWFPLDTIVSQLDVMVDDTTKIRLIGSNQFGCTTSDSVVLYPLSLPKTRILYDTNKVCQGKLITLKASGADNYQWSPHVDSSRNFQVMVNDTMKIKLIGTAKDGCIVSDSVTLFPLKLPKTKIIYDTNKVCQGMKITLAASGADSYLWLPAGNSNPTFPVMVSDTVKINLTGNNQNGCVASDSVTLYPLPLPKTKIIYDTNKVCRGTTVNLSASGADNYSWSPGDNSNPTFPVTVNDTLRIKLTGTNQDGCVVSDSVQLYPLSVPSTKILFDTNYVCQGTLTHLTASGADRYLWLPNQKTRSDLPVIVNDTLKIILKGFSSEGCTTDDSVELYPLSQPKTKIIYSAGSVCQGTLVNLKASGADSYQWFPMDSTGSQLSLKLKQPIKIRLVGFNNSGCSSKDSLELTPFPVPKVDFSGLSPFYCMNELPVTLNGSPAGGVFSGAGMQGDVFSPSNAGKGFHDIVYTFTTDHGCTSKSTKRTLISGPVPTIKLSPADTTLKEGGSVDYDAGPGFTHYYWTTGDTTRKIEVDYAKAFSEIDTIRVEGLVDNCVSVGSAVVRFSQISGIPKNKIKMTTAFPNPNDGQFYINYNRKEAAFVIKVYDFSGKVVLEKKHHGLNPDGRIQFNLQGLQSGIYFVSLYFKSEVIVAKVIIR